MKLEEAIKTNKFDSELHKATVNVLYTANWLKNSISRPLKKIGLTVEQFNVMRILKGKHPETMRVKDIKSRVLEENSNVPRIVEKLVIKKLAQRQISEADKRETLVSLTPGGLALLSQASIIVREINASIKYLPEHQAGMLNDFLEKMRQTEGIRGESEEYVLEHLNLQNVF